MNERIFKLIVVILASGIISISIIAGFSILGEYIKEGLVQLGTELKIGLVHN